MSRAQWMFNTQQKVDKAVAEIESDIKSISVELQAATDSSAGMVITQPYRQLTIDEQIEEYEEKIKEYEEKRRLLILRKGEAALKEIGQKEDNSERQEAIKEFAIVLEAIILYKYRPALTINKNKKGQYSTDEDLSSLGSINEDSGQKWGDLLEKHLHNTFDENKGNGGIYWNAVRVGRIETGNTHFPPWLGTAFLLSEDVMVTNRHVITYKDFCWRDSDGSVTWSPRIPHTVNFSVLHLGKDSDSKTKFKAIPYLANPKEHDCSLVKIDDDFIEIEKPIPWYSGPPLEPESLKGRLIYAIGHPSNDTSVPKYQRDYVFRGIYGDKRIMPGKLMEEPLGEYEGVPVLMHDCSTLGGASGSCLIDLGPADGSAPGDSFGKVIGLHWGGEHAGQNYAVPIWELKEILEKHL